VEKNIASLKSMTSMLSDGMTPSDICSLILNGFEYEIMDQYSPEYRCTCSRQRITRAFCAMKPDELVELPDETGKVEVSCRFCGKAYYFTRDEIENISRQ
jgi:molecular chaperone Hsp33